MPLVKPRALSPPGPGAHCAHADRSTGPRSPLSRAEATLNSLRTRRRASDSHSSGLRSASRPWSVWGAPGAGSCQNKAGMPFRIKGRMLTGPLLRPIRRVSAGCAGAWAHSHPLVQRQNGVSSRTKLECPLESSRKLAGPLSSTNWRAGPGGTEALRVQRDATGTYPGPPVE
jgi:hypothetical protein